MTSFLLENSDHTSLVALYRKIDLTKEKLLSLYASPLRMQPLLHLEAALPAGGSISLLPCGDEELLLCVRTKSYASAHACACALVELFRQAEEKDCQNENA